MLKKVRLDNVGTKERAAAFQEVHLLSGLRHPCILRYHAHFTHLKVRTAPSPTHSLTHSLAHSLTHSLTCRASAW